ncbi:MAG TPA: NAD(P)H-hydrate dehydratase [Terriglobales bacterium]|nr:NAD(P)H-hydrate dehydratase [Terriglobales bacterium]
MAAGRNRGGTAMKVVTAAEMRDIDRVTSERFQVPSLTLMENAGTAVADFVLSRYPWARRIGVICGKGNNGGDGFVAARKLLDSGREVRILLLGEPSELQGDAAEMFSRLPVSPQFARSNEELNQEPARAVFDGHLLVDAILGTGFRPPVRGLYAQAIQRLNQGRVPVVAVDLPSGADADVVGEQTGAVARADGIITFTAPRPAHVFGGLGGQRTRIAPIGSPQEAVVSSLHLNLITAHDIAPLVGSRPRESNKGSFGHVLVVGGSLGKAGAAAMAGMSALRVGAGLSTIATPKSVLPTVAGFHPEVMTEPLEETDAGTISLRALAQLEAVATGKNVLALGPGISRNPETSELVRALVKQWKGLLVLDADGLNAFAGLASELDGNGKSLVITPHPGEMARLTGMSITAIQRDRINVARSFAHEHNLIVVLKGHRTLAAEPKGEVWVNPTGNPGMATGGTGDILTGMVAGMMAQNPQRTLQAVIAAVFLHGGAGDVVEETLGEHSLVATDLLSGLPEAFRRVRTAGDQPYIEIAA